MRAERLLVPVGVRFRHVCSLFLPLLLAGALGGPTPRALAQQIPVERLEGTLLVVWGDPHPLYGSTADVRYSLALPNGQVLALRATGLEAAALANFGRRVVVSGRRAAGPVGADGTAGQLVVVDAIAPAQPVEVSRFAGPDAAVFGTRNVIFLLVQFSDDAAVPHAPGFYTDLTNPLTPPPGALFPATINGFFDKTSWQQFLWQGDVGGVGGLGAPGGWLTLPHPKSYYAPCGFSASCANLNALSADAVTLAKAQGISFQPYDNINFVVSNDLDCCAWGGSYYLDGKSYGATWEPPWGQETGVYTHEMGHSLGLPHSGWVYYSYDSPWDMMSARRSASSMACGSYMSKNAGMNRTLFCTEPGDGYITPHKDVLGWIPQASLAVTDTYSGLSAVLDGSALPLSPALKMIKICLPGFACTGSSARFLTVEARVRGLGSTSQYDNAIPGEGVIIHDVRMNRPAIGGACYFNTQSGWAVPIDATPGDYNTSTCTYANGTALFNAQFTPGQTYTNSVHGVSVSVVSRSGSTFVVNVDPVPVDWIQNGSFAGGSAAWQTYATPDMSYITSNVTSGLLQFSRVAPPPGTTNQATVFQQTGVQVGAFAALAARFDLGNTSSVRKRISVLAVDASFNDIAVCTFWLPPNAPLRTYQMKTHTTQAWSNASIYFYAATANVNGDTGFYQVDNVSMGTAQGQSTARTDCVDPTTPAAPGGGEGANMVTNGDFQTGTLPPWFVYGQITHRISVGVFEFVRPAGSPPGVVAQFTSQALNTNAIVAATVQLGNSSGVRKRVTVLLHDSDFSDLAACTFWLPPGQPLSPYTMRAFATEPWANATIAFYPSTVGTEQWIRLDNAALTTTPAVTIPGTACIEPGGV